MAKPGNEMTISLDGDIVCIERMAVAETLTTADITNTCSPTVAVVDAVNGNHNIVFEQIIGTAKKMVITLDGSYNALGAGDPPLVDLGDVVTVAAACGPTIAGDSFMVTQWDFNGEIKGALKFSIQLTSNGLYTVT